VSDSALPTFNLSFDLNSLEVPETDLMIQFDDMELYLELNTVFSGGATYEINLYTSLSLIGIKLGPISQLGVVAAVDIILSVQSVDVDISSGFYIKMEDGVVLNIALLGNKISKMTL
jgi:hypothetical protein